MSDVYVETHPFDREPALTYYGDLQVTAPRVLRFWLDLSEPRPVFVLTQPPTARQRRLCARTGHPASITASWWEGIDPDGMAVRYHRTIALCARCGAETARI